MSRVLIIIVVMRDFNGNIMLLMRKR